MQSAGYMRKKVSQRPPWLRVESVVDIYSVSGCISGNFADYINYWKHNGYWFFDSPSIIEKISTDAGIDLSGTSLFYYEVYELEYDEDVERWMAFFPESSFRTNVQIPVVKRLEGFDVVTFCARTTPECSPLSCGHLAEDFSVNEHCLFHSFEEAKRAAENGFLGKTEPGPYRVFAVYTLEVSPDSA